MLTTFSFNNFGFLIFNMMAPKVFLKYCNFYVECSFKFLFFKHKLYFSTEYHLIDNFSENMEVHISKFRW